MRWLYIVKSSKEIASLQLPSCIHSGAGKIIWAIYIVYIHALYRCMHVYIKCVCENVSVVYVFMWK